MLRRPSVSSPRSQVSTTASCTRFRDVYEACVAVEVKFNKPCRKELCSSLSNLKCRINVPELFEPVSNNAPENSIPPHYRFSGMGMAWIPFATGFSTRSKPRIHLDEFRCGGQTITRGTLRFLSQQRVGFRRAKPELLFNHRIGGKATRNLGEDRPESA